MRCASRFCCLLRSVVIEHQAACCDRSRYYYLTCVYFRWSNHQPNWTAGFCELRLSCERRWVKSPPKGVMSYPRSAARPSHAIIVFRFWSVTRHQESSTMSNSIIPYYRQSTKKQERSGLGLEVQRSTVRKYVNDTGSQVIGTYIETESGTKSDRPQLARALRSRSQRGSNARGCQIGSSGEESRLPGSNREVPRCLHRSRYARCWQVPATTDDGLRRGGSPPDSPALKRLSPSGRRMAL